MGPSWQSVCLMAVCRYGKCLRASLKGQCSKDRSWPENTENVQSFFHLPASFGCCVNIYTKEALWRFSSAMLIPSSARKSRKELDCDGFDTFVTHASLVYDVTDTDSLAQNGSTQGHAFI